MPKAVANTIEILKPGRLKKRPEFLLVAQSGRKWVSDSIVIQYAPRIDPDGSGVRIGYTATKKVSKSAVIRNRAKRRLRAAVTDITAQTALKPADIVLIARDTTATCDWDKLCKDLQWCLKRLDALCVPPHASP